MRRWTEDEILVLREAYAAAGPDGVLGLDAVASRLGRAKSNVCRKARQIGIETNQRRRTVEARKDRRKFKGDAEALKGHQRFLGRDRIARAGHPRGMAGKSHTETTKAVIAKTSKSRWDGMSQDERDRFSASAYRALVESGGGAPKIGRGAWKAGWREIGGKRNFYRSRWEANYARYLEWLKSRGEIADWVHEPEVFWFEQIRRGTRSYKPDFRVWEAGGASNLHEVKGWMDQRSRTCLLRMAKYHPHETIILIDGPQYRAIRSAVMALIPDWEDSARDRNA